jgi:hypothetical protein
MHIDTGAEAFGNSTAPLHPNESTNDLPLAENNINGNSLTDESNNFGQTSQIETGAGDWNYLYSANRAGYWNSSKEPLGRKVALTEWLGVTDVRWRQ